MPPHANEATDAFDANWAPRTFEERLKAGGLVVAVTYALGMLVVTLHQTRYGVWPIEILKPRAFGAGTLLVVTWAAGAFIAARVFGYFGFTAISLTPGLDKDKNLERLLRNTLFTTAATLVGVLLGPFVFPEVGRSTFNYPGMACAGLAYAVVYRAAFVKLVRVHQRVALAIASLAICTGSLWYWDSYGGWLVLWLLCSGGLTMISPQLLAGVLRGDPDNIFHRGLVLVVLLILFTRTIYFNASPAFGGGYSPLLTFHMKEPLPHEREKTFDAYLLDENYLGYFVLKNRDTRQARWIPRDAVGLVVHHGAPQDSAGTVPNAPAARPDPVRAPTTPTAQPDPAVPMTWTLPAALQRPVTAMVVHCGER